MTEVIHEFLFPATRLDWFGAGPSSPNKTGTLLAILFLLCWWPALRFRWGFWVSLPLSFLCGVFLIQTGSRGGIVALAVGMLLMLWFQFGVRGFRAIRTADILSALSRAKCRNRRKEAHGTQRSNPLGSRAFCAFSWRLNRPLWSMSAGIWRRGISLLIFIIVLFVYSMEVGTGQRLAHMTSGNDGSANVRVKLYTSGMRMIAGAPSGWGHGTASSVYQQWYQTPDDDRTYLSLVNSHLTWMSEYGLLFQAVYICAWMLILQLCFPAQQTPLRITAFSCWFALGVGGVFSSVLTLLWLWLVPLFLLALCMVQRLCRGEWPDRKQFGLSGVCALFCFIGLHGAARLMPGKPEVVHRPGCIQVGEKADGVLLVNPDLDVLGERYGHTIRDQIDLVGCMTVVTDTNVLHELCLDDYSCVVLCGDINEIDFLDTYSGRVTLLSPSGGDLLKGIDESASYALRVVIGDMGDWRRSRRWKNIVGTNPDWELLEIAGAADYIPNWMTYCTGEGI